MKIEQAASHGGAFRISHAPDPEALQKSLDNMGMTLKMLSASRANDKEKFLKLMTTTFSLPDYFGDNWDAFYDCLTDLSLAEHGELWLIDGMEGLARHAPDEFAAAISVFSDAADYWRENRKSLAIIIVIQRAELASDLPAIDTA